MAINLGKPINNNPLGVDENGLRINKTVTNPTLPIGKTTSKINKKSNNNLLDDGYQFGDFSKMFWNEAGQGASNLINNIVSLPSNAVNTTKNILKESEALQDGYQFGDGLKTIGSTLLSTGQLAGEGVIRGGEGLVKFGADIFGGMSDHINTNLEKAVGLHKGKTKEEINKEKANSRTEMMKTNYTDALMKAVGKDDEYKKLVESNSLIKSDNMGGAITQELGRQSLNLLLANKLNAFQLPANVDKIGKIGNSAVKIFNKGLSSAPLIAGSYGSGMEEAYQNGATTNEARRYGILNAATETATEWVTGGIPGLKGSAGKGLDGLASKIIGEPIEETSKSLSKALLKSGYKLIGEGTEEALSEYINPYIKQFTYEYNNDKDVLGNIKEAHSKVSPQDMITSFIMGAITAGIIDAPNNLSDIKSGYVNGKIVKLNTKQNNINNSTENTTNLNNLQSSNINNQESINSSQSNLNLANNNLLNNDINTLSKPAYQYTPSDNEKINNLRESASKYFDNSANVQNLVNTFEKIIKDKNYNVVFDNTISNENGNQVNAQIKTLSNGETEIRINPNSDRAGEFLIMHEVTHAIETNSMKELVLDYASKNQEFSQNLESLKKTYGTEDVSSEVLSDISGQLFGNQEFINNLSMEKPNIFKRIYNSIVSLANKITGNSKESLFIKDLKNKWETAYRTQNSNVDNQKYHISPNISTDIDNVLNNINERNPVKIRDYTPKVLVDNGIKDLPMYENPSHIRKNILTAKEAHNKGLSVMPKDHYHGLGKDLYIKAIDSLDNPKVIFKRNNSNNYVILTAIKDNNNNNIIVPIEIETTTNVNNIKIDTNRVKTVYGYDIKNPNLNDYIKHNLNNNEFIKIYEQKKERGTGNSTVASSSYGNNITQSNDNVKLPTKYSMQNKENNTQELDNSSFSFDVKNINNLTEAESVQFFTKKNGKIYARAIGNNGLVYSGYFKKLNDLVKSFGKELGTYIYENSNNGFNEVKVKSKKQFNYWLNDSSNKKITNTDNLGRKLSDVQQEHFKNSKIRDDFGNLLTMYHGSENKFDVFKSDINWFTPSKKYSDLYGIKKNYLQSKISFLPSKSKYTYEVYLNVENPKILSNIDGYVSQEYDVNTFLNNSNLSKSQYEKILKEYNQNHTNDKAYHIYDLVNSKEFKNYLISEGYDGIIANEHGNTSCAVFNSNQIKNIKNSQPSDMLNINYSKENQTWQNHLEKNYKATGTRTNMKDYRLLPVPINSEKGKVDNNLKKQTIKEINQKKMDNNTNAISRLNQEKNAMISRIQDKIKAKKELLESKTNQDTKLATQLNIQISNLNNQLQNRKLDYDKRIEYYQNKNNKMNSEEFKIQEQRITKKQEYIDQAYEMTENMIDWKDKDRGIKYKVNTMKRNLYDIMPKLEADRMYNTYFQPITENNAKSENFINNYNERISKLELNNKESAAVQMLGEYKYNKETLITGQQVDDYISDNKLNYDKISNAVEEFRNIYDELIVETNKVLKEQGYKEIEYRKGYFPHFQEETRQGKFAKLAEKLGFNTSKNDQTLPTDIAGMTEIFKPGKTYFKNAQQRKGKVTDYNALKGYDNYIRGAADLIFHTEDIQKLRALENVIRTQYTDASIQKRLEDIYNNEGLDQEQKQKLVDEEYLKINNPLPNFVTELRDYTDNLANKKDVGDRGMEHMLGRETYTIMKDVQSRVSANMVGFNISSALTNFIPITQAWGEVSTKNMFKAIRESIANQFHDDGFADCSTYLINRTKAADRLYKTKLEDINSKAGVIFEGIDSITSNAIVRGKYYDNIDKGMSQEKAIKNANEFAKDIMAGRSKGDMPTIFNRKSPVIKLFTAFQLEVNNQYGYMLKDLPRNLSDEAKNKLIGAFVKMFVGAWLYNKFSEAVVGRKSAFSPIDIASEAIQTVQGDSSTYDKMSSISKSIVEELPFVGGIMGGGRLPIQSAIPDIGNTVESITQLGDSSKRNKAIKNLTTELSKPIFYVAMPFGGGQLKKTIEGASMYTHDVAGSYTSTGKLRFTAKKDPLSVAQSLLFGQYSSKEAREYFNNGYAPLTEKQTKEFKELGVSMNTYRQYRTDLASLKEIKNDKDSNGKIVTGSGTGKKAYQIMNNDKYTDKEKQYLLNNISSSEIKTSIKDLNKIANNEDVYKHYFSLSKDNKKKYLNAIEKYNFDSYQLYDYSQTKKKYEEQYTSSKAKEMVIDYLVSSDLSKDQKKYLYNQDYGSKENEKIFEAFNIDIDNYLNTMKYSSELKFDYQGNKYSDYRKQQAFKYIQNLNASVIEKAVLFKKAGYSITSYKSYIYNYLNNLDISQSSKAELWNQLF